MDLNNLINFQNLWNTEKNVLGKIIAETAKKFYLKGFKSQSWDNTAWQPLNPEYAKTKPKGTQMLVRDGYLVSALANSIKKTDFDNVVLRVDIDYASYHNQGSQDPANKNPNRPPKRTFMDYDDALEAEMEKALDKELQKWLDSM
jgi:phage gpG-like protein